MKVHPRVTFLVGALCLLAACGVKGPPKPPTAKSPQASQPPATPTK